MKLKTVSVIGYKSIKEKCELFIDNRITVLIGANDHGKSNLLKIIESLNDDKPITPEDRNWDLESEIQPRIEWVFSLSEIELQGLQENFGIDKRAIVSPLKEGDQPEGIETTIDELNEESIKENFALSENKELIFYREGINEPVKVLKCPIEITKDKEAELLTLRPKIELFDIPPNVSFLDSVSPENIKDENYEVMKGIFIKADIWNDRETIFTQSSATGLKLDDASKRLSEALTKEWDQGKNLEWKLLHDNGNISLEIRDPSVKNTFVKPSQRSSGFRTYFYLCMKIIARTYGSDSNQKYIYLFDEPGTYLHPKAQIDLQRSLEKIADNTQIVFTTHSLFLISKNYPKRNRVIVKTIDGTKINQRPFSDNWKSVRNSLGILMSNNLLIADKCLLVEGRSDVVYLMNIIRQLKDTKYGIDIDINDIAITDAGDSSNYPAMVKLMISDGRNVLCLVDSDDGGDTIENRVNKACKDLERPPEIIKFSEREKSIEDVCVDLELLKEAIKNVISNLVKNGERKLIKDFNIETAIEEIKEDKNQTLGTTIKKVTEKWFEDNESLSKLSISMEYVNLHENLDSPPEPSAEAIKLIGIIKDKLSLKGEKDYSEGVFEEIEKV